MTSPRPKRPKHHRVVVVGAGPGGLQLGYFLGRADVDYMVLEAATEAGSFFQRFPVHRRLLSINKTNTGVTDPEKNLRWDWNSLLSDVPTLRLSAYDQAYYPHADSLIRYLNDFRRNLRVRVGFGTRVTSIDKAEDRFLVCTNGPQDFTCEALVIATGLSLPYLPKIRGIELAEPYASHDRSVENCRNKDILIIGKGNSAFETAEALLPHAARIHLISPSRLRFAWQSHFPGHLRQINTPFFETFLLKQQNAVLNGTINEIAPEGNKFAVSITWSENGHNPTHYYDRVILCAGFKFDSSIFGERIEPMLVHDDRLPALTCHWESQNVRNLYFCGSLMQANDYKKSASAFLHGMRYNCATLSKLLQERLGVADYSNVHLPLDTDALLTSIFERIEKSSSLWHMQGSLCDAYLLDPENRVVQQVMDVPIKMLADDPRFRHSTRLEFRFTFDNPADPIERAKFTDVGLLHPALYLYEKGQLSEECHMYEDVYAEWRRRDFEFCFDSVVKKFVSRTSAAAARATHARNQPGGTREQKMEV